MRNLYSRLKFICTILTPLETISFQCIIKIFILSPDKRSFYLPILHNLLFLTNRFHIILYNINSFLNIRNKLINKLMKEHLRFLFYPPRFPPLTITLLLPQISRLRSIRKPTFPSLRLGFEWPNRPNRPHTLLSPTILLPLQFPPQPAHPIQTTLPKRFKRLLHLS
jgi:hypothetical protein